MTERPFADRITRCPRAIDTEQGRDAAEGVAGLPAPVSEVVAGTAGTSPYLAGLVRREHEWLAAALSVPPEAAMSAILEETRLAAGPDTGRTLRRLKGRAALLIGLADLAGVWPLATATAALTDFADAATGAALAEALRPELSRGRIPGQDEADLETSAGLAIIAMGKMGAHELNYSSDIDLICLFDESRFDEADLHEARSGFVRATRTMCTLLSKVTAEGYVFRTDLRLRPDAAVTPVAMSMEMAERYYESLGRTWERAAYIKARPAAGDIAAGDRFLDRLTPFIWRRHLDYWAIQDAHDMRLRIRDSKGLHSRPSHLGHDVKLGIGGIREIEFFTQTRQMIAGGRDESLRVRGTVDGLDRLARAGWIGSDDATALSDDYVALRELEHRIQMIGDQQTQTLPKSEEDFERIAALAGRNSAEFGQEVEERFRRVHRHTEAFFQPRDVSEPVAELPALSDEAMALIAGWPAYPALRSTRAAELFDRVRPALLARLERAAHPEVALRHIDGFLKGLPAGVQVLSLFDANPQLLDLIVDIADTSPALAAYLSRHSGVFDAVIGGDFFGEWPGRKALGRDLAKALAQTTDYERKLDLARSWTKEWHFRIGVHHLRALIPPEEAGWQYADLARAVLETLWPVVESHFAERHGPPPGRGAAVLGMGSLGAGRLMATSDLDVIVIYDAAGVEASEGPRPLSAGAYYARLTQAFVTALSAPTAAGRLYEVDMRLRPSGRQGPVATALSSFARYQSESAWTWEHLALTRARFVAGNPRVGDEVEAVRRDVLSNRRDRTAVLSDLRDMRSRLAAAKPGSGGLDPKNGPGRLQDIELFAAAAALLAGSPARTVERQFADGAGTLGLGPDDVDAAVALHGRLADLRQALTLIAAGEDARPDPGTGAEALVLRGQAAKTLDELGQSLDMDSGRVSAAFVALVEAQG